MKPQNLYLSSISSDILRLSLEDYASTMDTSPLKGIYREPGIYFVISCIAMTLFETSSGLFLEFRNGKDELWQIKYILFSSVTLVLQVALLILVSAHCK
jgi:hypothetical protein